MTMNCLSKICLILILINLYSCVSEKRCQKRFPPKTETIIEVKDTTIFTEVTRFDTAFILKQNNDTMYFHDTITNIKVKFIRMAGDTIKIFAECPPDTIIVEKEILTTIHTTKLHQEWKDIAKKILWILGIVFALIMSYKFIKLFRDGI